MIQISKAFRRNSRTDLHARLLAKQYLQTQVHCELHEKQLAAIGVGPGVTLGAAFVQSYILSARSPVILSRMVEASSGVSFKLAFVE